MYTALIIDDESKSRKSLRQKLVEYCPQIEVVGEAANGIEGLTAIAQRKPDVVFLDIEMPNMNGLQMLEQLNNFSGAIIFTTAYNEYAIKAFKFSAFDYLLKPIDIEELKDTVNRFVLLKEKKESTDVTSPATQLQILLNQLQGKAEGFKKIAIHTQDALHFFELDEIIRFEAHSNYTHIFFKNGTKLVASKTLKEFEDILLGAHFFRVHHSAIINLLYIKKYIKGDGGSIELTDGTMVDVSRRRKDEFLQLIK